MAAPYGTEKTAVITSTVAPVVKAAPVVGPPQWTQTLCGCMEHWPVCCEEFWCAYCHLGYLYDTLETGGRDMDPIVCCGALCIDMFVGGIARCLVIMHLRSRITTRYQIPESGVKVCCLACFCGACAMCQMHRELEGRHEYTGGCCYTAPVPAGALMGAQVQPQEPHHEPVQPQPYQQQPYQPQYMQPAYAPAQQQHGYAPAPQYQQQMHTPPPQGYAPAPQHQQVYQPPL
jgi:Cys-rich protein (TIGR01571 family)